jgi:hypothetical protein
MTHLIARRTAAICLAIGLLCHGIVYPAPQPPNSPKSSQSQRFLNDAPVVTITNLDLLASDAFHTDRANRSIAIDSILYKSKNDGPSLNISRDQFYQIVREQKASNDSMQGQLDMFNAGKKFVGAFADLGGPVGTFAFTVGDTYLDRFNNKLRSEMENSQRDLAEQFFAGRTIDSQSLRKAQALGLRKFAEEVESQSGLPEAFNDLPTPQQVPALVRLGEFTLTTVALQGEDFAAANSANNAEFQRLRIRIGNIENCQKTLTSKMSSLMTETEANTTQLAEITKTLDSQHQDLGLMQQAMFSHLTVDEQLNLIRNSKSLPLTDDERQSMVDNLTKRKVLLDEAEKWNTFVHTGNDLIGIIDKLGVDKDIVTNVKTGLSAADTTYSAINAALSGNYFGAVNAILGLFGGGGMDAESAHYAAIMGRLDEIVETQKKIIDTQKAIVIELRNIETLIIQNQNELRGVLDSIFFLQANTLDAVIQIKAVDLNACNKFIGERYPEDSFVSADGQFKDYGSMQAYFATHWRDYDICSSLLNLSIANISNDVGLFFGSPVSESEAIKTSNATLVTVMEPVRTAVAPFFAYLTLFVPDTDPDKRTVVGTFFEPSIAFDILAQKERMERPAKPRYTPTAEIHHIPEAAWAALVASISFAHYGATAPAQTAQPSPLQAP